MTYKDFINTLSRRMGYETEYAESLSAAFVTAISQTLQAGKNVCLRGLGNLYVFKQLELIAENPLTGQKTLQPPRLEVKFEPANTETTNDPQPDTVGATACPRPQPDTPQTPEPSPENDDTPDTDTVGATACPRPETDAPQTDESETFPKQFFSLLEEGLRIDSYVNIKGLGTFKKIEGTVTYVPDTSLRDTINKPFSQFEPVVLAEGVDFSALDAKHAEECECTGRATARVAPTLTTCGSGVEAVEEPAAEDVPSQDDIPDANTVGATACPRPETDTPNDADTVGTTACPRPQPDTPQTNDEPKPAEPTSDEGLPWGIIAPIFLAGLLIGGFLVWAIMTYWN